jgi:hypothetical protein
VLISTGIVGGSRCRVDALAGVVGGALRELPSGCSCDGRLALVDGLLGGGAGTSDTPAAGVVGGSVLISTGIVGGSRCRVGRLMRVERPDVAVGVDVTDVGSWSPGIRMGVPTVAGERAGGEGRGWAWRSGGGGVGEALSDVLGTGSSLITTTS